MPLNNAFLAHGSWWSSPFCRWQGSFAGEHAMKLAASTGKSWLEAKGVPGEAIDGLVMGISVHQKRSFYGAPWLAGMMGLDHVTGTTVSQACATGARMLASAALEVETGQRNSILAVACDRTSNGPHVYYPNPAGPGGMGVHEDPVWDNFGLDPHAGNAMSETGENVARREGITREEQDAMALMRAGQYEAALADDRAFQRRYMAPVTIGRGRRAKVIDADEGVFPTTAEGLAKLRPAAEGGTITFGSQTHPADANAGLIVCNADRAAELSGGSAVRVQLLSYGEARVEKGFMPTATVPAAMAALKQAGLGVADVDAFKTHNPFAVNDVYFCREMGVEAEVVNNYGSPLVYGHPQAPMGLRVVIELCEELILRGGGVGLFTGCAAGDSAMSVVVKVTG